jgi:hypothetical protein
MRQRQILKVHKEAGIVVESYVVNRSNLAKEEEGM